MLIGVYNPLLVVFSIVVAILASYTALDMAGRIASASGRYANAWLGGGAFAMGLGVWSMHFVGMLAFRLPISLGYDLGLTLLSLLIAIGSSAFALWSVCRIYLSRLRLTLGALVMGAGISSMHYVGMAAMKMNPGIIYDLPLVLVSIGIAIIASASALWIAFHLRNHAKNIISRRLGAAVVMGAAIVGMHYTGMAAAWFPDGSFCGAANQGISVGWLAVLVIVVTFFVIGIALIISVLDLKMEQRTKQLSRSLDLVNSELLQLAMCDPLTKLSNRTALNEKIDLEVKVANRHGTRFAVFFLDLDGFKAVNDAYGHHLGDQLLVMVASRIQNAVRAEDTIARVGGDEFVVMAKIRNTTDAAQISAKLIEILQASYHVSGHDLAISASVGIAIYPDDAKDRHELLVHADAAMYHAKDNGRNGYYFFESSMNANAQHHLQMLQELRHVIERGELELHYQPKFSAPQGPIIGTEALLRWRHPVRGLIPPMDFLPLAEKTGIIIPIGNWVLNEACRQLRNWHDSGFHDWSIAVNLSAVQFSHPGLLASIQSALFKHDIEPRYLTLEVTESTAMRDIISSLKILDKLSTMGVCISIDDFGTGHSSLMYLKQLPAQELKIDKGFLNNLSGDGESLAIISKIIELGQILGMKIVAEGVETIEQQQMLTSLGCDTLQGFLLGHPVTAQELFAHACELSQLETVPNG